MAASQLLDLPFQPMASDALHRQIVETLEDGVYFVDRDRRIQSWNAAAEQISGYAADEVVGRSCFDNLLNHVDETGRVLCFTACPLAGTIEDGKPRQTFVYLRHRDGHRVPVRVRAGAIRDDTGAIVGAAEVFDDASPIHEVARENDELRRLAFVDELTGLPNRRALDRAIAGRLASLERHGWGFGLLVIDVDDFKSINDLHGHAVGDVAIRLVARTIANACRSEDFVARWGGDEFVVLVSAADVSALDQAGERIRALVARSRLTADGSEIAVSVSVGAAVADAEDSIDSIFERADRALYRTKPEARSRKAR